MVVFERNCKGQVLGRGDVPQSFGNEGLSKLEARFGRTHIAHPDAGFEMGFKSKHFAHFDELLRLVVKQANLFF